MTMKNMAGAGVGDDGGGLAELHAGELILLEIGIDPQAARWHDRQQISGLRDIGSDARRAIADIAVNWRTDFGITEIKPGSLEIGASLGNRSTGFGDIRIQDAELLFRCGQPGLRRRDSRARLL